MRSPSLFGPFTTLAARTRVMAAHLAMYVRADRMLGCADEAAVVVSLPVALEMIIPTTTVASQWLAIKFATVLIAPAGNPSKIDHIIIMVCRMLGYQYGIGLPLISASTPTSCGRALTL